MLAQLQAMTLVHAILMLVTVAMLGILIVLIARGARPPDDQP